MQIRTASVDVTQRERMAEENHSYNDPVVSLRVPVTESQAEKLKEALLQTAPSVTYGEEQHGAELLVHIRCSPDHERAVQRLLDEMGLLPSG